MQANSITVVLFSLYSISTTSGTAQESLVEQARRMEGKAEAVVELHVPRMTVPEMVGASSLILRGRIAAATPRLSEDQSVVYTEYTVEPVEILKLPSALVTASKPGIAPPIVFIQIGGELEVDGLNYYSRQQSRISTHKLVLDLPHRWRPSDNPDTCYRKVAPTANRRS